VSVFRSGAAFFAIALAIAGCGAAAPSPEPSLASDRCHPGDPLQIGILSNALSPGYSIRNVVYVRSNDFGHVIFMAGDLQGPDLPGDHDIATFATDLAAGSNTYYEIDDLATKYSGWIPGSAAGYSMNNDGAALAKQCAGDLEAQPAAS
jgi:hypothetical protein